MNEPVTLRLVEIKDGKYKIEYPNLSVPIEINEHLFYKFLSSNEFMIEGDTHKFPILRSYTNSIENQNMSA
ncbi:hypothetical protein J8281_08145 [Aquimarina sp. U1-2]|uniref:hypothetical protein n=1 Tax=Aquimarina sp. U1-2 TaxID=2823141 RepID=UPI001AEC9D8F|nr:hypothetical protein [Aquimarina sp. U1-2]MBP2832157.1 hypothetical protein [Aquimarina sp. U1-2]